MPFTRQPLPQMALVRQELRSDRIEDAAGDVAAKLMASGLPQRIRPGQHVAITAGSRGIGAFVELLSGIVRAVEMCGGYPFIIPAMGSHGGATASGQTEILRRLGVTEGTVGAPIRATMDTQVVGES